MLAGVEAPTIGFDQHGRPEPPVNAGETATILGFLEFHRATLAWKCAGLYEAGMRATVGASTLTLGGLLKHVTFGEDSWLSHRLHGHDPATPWDAVDWDANPEWDLRLADEDTAEDLVANWQNAVTRSRVLVAEALADGGLDRLAVWSDARYGPAPNLRWILMHMTEGSHRQRLATRLRPRLQHTRPDHRRHLPGGSRRLPRPRRDGTTVPPVALAARDRRLRSGRAHGHELAELLTRATTSA